MRPTLPELHQSLCSERRFDLVGLEEISDLPATTMGRDNTVEGPPVPSVEPSSTTMTSNSGYVCARTLIRAASTCRARLKVGMTTDTRGL